MPRQIGWSILNNWIYHFMYCTNCELESIEQLPNPFDQEWIE